MHAQARRDAADDRAAAARRVAPGHDRRRLAGRRRAPAIRLREARVRAILGVPVARERQARDPAARSTSPPSRADDGLDVTVPALRRDDVTREVDLIEEVARIDGLERLPATLPARRGAAGHAHATPSACAARPRTRWSAAACTRSSAGASPTPALLDRLRLPAGARAAARRDAREPAVGGAVDHAPDAARLAARRRPAQRRAQRPRRRDLRVGHRLPRARRETASDRPADEHHALGVLLSGALGAALVARRARRGRLLRRQGAARRRCSTRFARRLVGAAGRRVAVPAPRAQRRRCSPATARAPRLPRRAAPARRGRVGPRAHGRVRDRPRQARRAAPAGRRVPRRSRRCPSLRQDLAVTLPDDGRRRARCSQRVRGAGGEMLEDVQRVRRLHRRAGRGGPALARARAVLPRARAHAHRRGRRARCASGSSRRCGELGGELRG